MEPTADHTNAGRGWAWGDVLLALPVVAGVALLVGSVFLHLGAPEDAGPGLDADGHVALRLTIVIAAVVTAALMRLMFHSQNAGVDQAVDEGLSATDGRPIRAWEDLEGDWREGGMRGSD